MFLLPLLPLFCAIFSSAEIHCYHDPAIVLPTLASCNRVFNELRTWADECGDSPRDFGPAPASPGGISLPLRFIDPIQSSGPVKCGIDMSWAPRPWVPPPPPLGVERFSPWDILWQAGTMMRMCFYSYRPEQPSSLQLGYTWIKPHQWVLVQIVAVVVDEGNSGSGDGNLTVVLGNGTNVTVDANMSNPSTCGSSITLANTSGNTTEAVVAA